LVNLEINKRPADLYFVEDFFSKELIERNQHRDSYIFTFDEVKHPSLDKMTDAQKIDLKMLQKDLREQPYGLMDVEKFDVFTSLLFLAQNKHPILNDNFHFFYNAVTNKVEPLVREVWFESELFIENESDLNKKIATFLNGLKTYNKNLHVYLNGIIDDQKRLSDIQAKVVELAEDIRELNLNPSWCQIKNDIYARFPQALFICKNIDLNTQEILDLNIESKKKAKIENSSIVFKEDVQLTENLHLKNTNLIFNSGISVDLNGHSIFIKNGSIEAISKPKTEIVITNSNLDQGSSIVVDNSKIPNTLRNVRISQLSNHNDRYWHLPGGITFYESDVTIENSVFSSNRGGDDFINFFRCSSFKLNNVRFNDVMADAIDSDFSKGIITNCEFEAIGNDAVDASGSQISVISSHFKNVADKAISAGEGSRVRVTRSKIEDSEISFVAKDDSVVLEDHNELQNNKLDYCIFNKKKEFRNGVLYTDKNITEFNYLIEERSEVFKGLKQIVNLKMVDSVKESLYGIEYGKKSIRQ
ncbi:MAG: right-handed parallel beta-helix repeat-containing protein, partial [Flavobacteriaceae bacterium]|nr:right-handed parallel beta-helix repeat-containing protein [Flavobacteriaceae bacterium]